MLIKFVLKNLILVAVVAFAINWLINANIHLFSHAVAPHQAQLHELTQDEPNQVEILNENSMLN